MLEELVVIIIKGKRGCLKEVAEVEMVLPFLIRFLKKKRVKWVAEGV
jgi:hypothetical protein